MREDTNNIQWYLDPNGDSPTYTKFFEIQKTKASFTFIGSAHDTNGKLRTLWKCDYGTMMALRNSAAKDKISFKVFSRRGKEKVCEHPELKAPKGILRRVREFLTRK